MERIKRVIVTMAAVAMAFAVTGGMKAEAAKSQIGLNRVKTFTSTGREVRR